MADFKLVDVAKRAGITVSEALEKLNQKGVVLNDPNATISVDHMRLLGVDPQQMIDRRRERLLQALERRNRGSKGKEVVMNSRAKEESASTPRPSRLSKQEMQKELQKRKNDLNKDLLKVDEDRQTYLKNKEQEDALTENKETDNTAKAIEQVVSSTAEDSMKPILEVESDKDSNAKKDSVTDEIKVTGEKDNKAVVQDRVVNKTSGVKDQATEKKPAHKDTGKDQSNKPRTPTPRPLGPAGYVPREKRDNRDSRDNTRRTYPRREYSTDGRQPRTDQRGPQNRGTYQDRQQRGPGSGSSYQDRQQRGPSNERRPYQDRQNDQDRPYNRDRNAVNRGKTQRPETGAIIEEERRWEPKKPKEVEIPAKEEAKKKVKTETSRSRDWTKVIHEGMDELNIEKEIETEAAEAVEVVPEVVTPVKSERKQRRKHSDRDRHTREQQVFQRPSSITIGESVVVAELAGMIGVKAAELVKKLFSSGVIATVNQSIDSETAALLCLEYGVDVNAKIITEEDLLPVYHDKPEELEKRPPVVTVMGHVDHGKTSLLDAIRSAAVAEREAGGITQHIGAYEVELKGRKITFLDTPGHEAFTSLRARGAQVTDIVILVVAANDGVMPQTKEAIDHAKAAGVRIVVAINKIDRPDANPDKVKQQLADYGIISDEWGGDYQFQEISAKKNMGIEDLLERVLLEADVLELKGNPNRPAEGIIIESQLDKHKGAVATVLVKTGTLKRGDTFLVGNQVGKVRSMQNYRGVVCKEAGISTPVEVMGFSNVPESGDLLVVIEDEKVAKSVAEIRSRTDSSTKQVSGGVISLSDFFNKVKEGEVKELNIIIKSDVQGSLEALKNSLLKLSNIEVKVNIVHDATGGINESDVVLAMASKAIIIGFNVRPDNNAKVLADKEGISIELYSVIYKAIEDVKLALEGMLTPDSKENIIGKVEVRQVFSVPKLGKIAGSYVLEGKVTRSSLARVIRDNVVIYDGKIGSLRRFTDDVKEVAHGYECGLSIDKYQDIKEGDILEIYEIVEEKRTLEDVKSE